MIDLTSGDRFAPRHLGDDAAWHQEMLKTVGVSSLDQLIDETVPAAIRLKKPMQLPAPQTESEFLRDFKSIADKNLVFKNYIGLGYYGTHTPPVILRNILENPGWYTAYTPYQAEIAQGRLEMLINFQTLVCDLTGMSIANASLLDEATAAAEAMALLHASRKPSRAQAKTLLVQAGVFPQTIDVLITRAEPLGWKVEVKDITSSDLENPEVFALMLQSPDRDGVLHDFSDLIAEAHRQSLTVCVASDLLALTLVKSPGEMGADVVVGSAQRFGVPMGFGGPHAGFFATSEEYKRNLPGRLIGVSIDANGKPAYRMSLQTREQHIRREKATSNICTAQVLLSVMAAAYAVYHGPEGLRTIASRTHGMAVACSQALSKAGYTITSGLFFDTVKVGLNQEQLTKIRSKAQQAGVNFRYEENAVLLSFDETTTVKDLAIVLGIFGIEASPVSASSLVEVSALNRTSAFLTHPVFHNYHTEHGMLRYLKHLENKDLSLTHSMISLGSCTMKLNSTTEMIPVTWSTLGNLHPFAPADQTKGYEEIITNLEKWLCEVTGFASVSLQPNSGAQGEYAGLLVIRAYQKSLGQGHRNVALIPSSAHGTNPASAVMAGLKVVVVKCDEKGNIDVSDLLANIEKHRDQLSCLMVTYPSTHGVFEESIIDICEAVHAAGGQVYMDGANMNAQVGVTSPATIGADVCHLNLHKTFCIPHGGGGPGVGPIGVAAHLSAFLPGHVQRSLGYAHATHAVSAAPWGSASILPIPYAYVAMMGAEGLTNATKHAILNANYMKARLEQHYPILYTGTNGRCAHEFILDCREFKHSVGIEVEDIAKRLMDYGFHAPTVSFPVPGTLMVEPTESESKEELDRFCDALISIRAEIREIEEGKADKLQNVLKNAPHTAASLLTDQWTKPYSREKAAYPLPFVRLGKFWPSVGRIDNAYGDRNLVCTCLPVEEYIEA
ncbi:MAG: aminomethyl-transferring glycine dehydrogenase [Cytophagaceae bacterium]|nr:aminomethyl-transferring glycine dehydrogenase [Cytophagaceae bacterium]